jgi:hypothetical protein
VTYYKIFTHDLRPPVQGGAPIFDGSLPFELPTTNLDNGYADCAAGWNWTTDLAIGLKIAGLWRSGRPCRVFVGEPTPDVLQRGVKHRSSGGLLTLELSEDEIRVGVEALSAPFGEHAAQLADEQMAWREALGRPLRDDVAVEAGLGLALEARGLNWTLKRFDAGWGARAAWEARGAWDAWDALDAWDAWDAWEARSALAAREVLDAWAAWDTRSALAARDARDALSVNVAVLMFGLERPYGMLTAGLRDAYRHGLAIAIPTGPNELGFALEAVPQ